MTKEQEKIIQECIISLINLQDELGVEQVKNALQGLKQNKEIGQEIFKLKTIVNILLDITNKWETL